MTVTPKELEKARIQSMANLLEEDIDKQANRGSRAAILEMKMSDIPDEVRTELIRRYRDGGFSKIDIRESILFPGYTVIDLLGIGTEK